MQTQKIVWHTFDNPEDLSRSAFDAIAQCATEAIAERDRFLVVLSGGRTPASVYELLCHAQTDWSKWHVYHGDERCLPPEDGERNSMIASRALLEHVPIPAAQIHPIPAELGPAEGAAAYSAILEGVGTFDLVLLGLGEDGHTASLFPGHAWEQHPQAPVIPVRNAPKPPPERVSLSASRLSDARRVIFLLSGVGKRRAVQQWRDNVGHSPARAIIPAAGVAVFLDKAAAVVDFR
jgi:6-phosphogluconolactonase